MLVTHPDVECFVDRGCREFTMCPRSVHFGAVDRGDAAMEDNGRPGDKFVFIVSYRHDPLIR